VIDDSLFTYHRKYKEHGKIKFLAFGNWAKKNVTKRPDLIIKSLAKLNKQVKKMVVEDEKGRSIGGGSRIINQKVDKKTIDVDLVSIDEAIPEDRYVSIIHLDIEGYEKPALNGALNTIKRSKPILILEDNNNVIQTDWFAENILSLGYERFGFVNFNSVFKHKDN